MAETEPAAVPPAASDAEMADEPVVQADISPAQVAERVISHEVGCWPLKQGQLVFLVATRWVRALVRSHPPVPIHFSC